MYYFPNIDISVECEKGVELSCHRLLLLLISKSRKFSKEKVLYRLKSTLIVVAGSPCDALAIKLL
jgi:hypothetical protein